MTSLPDAELPALGEAFAGKYTLVRVVGEGGMGVVYEAQHARLEQRVAIKVLRADARNSAEWIARFDREARAAVRLRGANVARVFDVDSLPDGTPYMVMELLEGNDLALELAARGRLPVEEAVGYMLEACAAMAEAHALGIIHRDLTPANLFLAWQDGRRMIKIVDFGISKLIDDRSHVTASDAAFGTPHYVSPEQIRSSARVDARTDIWSLGVILFEMLAGSLPFAAATASAAVASVIADQPRSLRDLRPDIPKRLLAAVMKALTKNPAERYATVEEFAAAIAPFGPGASKGDAATTQPGGDRTSGVSQPPILGGRKPFPSASSGSAAWSRSSRFGWLKEPRRSTWMVMVALGVALGVAAVLLYRPRRAPGELPAAAPAAAPAALSVAAPALGEGPCPDGLPCPPATAGSSRRLSAPAASLRGSAAPSAPRAPRPQRSTPAAPPPPTAAPAPAKPAPPTDGRANPIHL